jgi:hypothetical protein
MRQLPAFADILLGGRAPDLLQVPVRVQYRFILGGRGAAHQGSKQECGKRAWQGR